MSERYETIKELLLSDIEKAECIAIRERAVSSFARFLDAIQPRYGYAMVSDTASGIAAAAMAGVNAVSEEPATD